jgi:hypothetical protein
MVESRMGAVAWAMRQRPVSHPRSSNRTCRSPASGSPTGFTVRHTGSRPTARGFSTGSTLLRPSTQQSRTAPVFSGVFRLIANHHDLAIFESAPEVRALCSAGVTRPQRSYDPVRLPSWPMPSATLRPLPSPLTGLPRLPEPPFRRAVPTTPADQAGAHVDCFPARAAFPKWQEGRHPHCHFRGLLRLHSRYGPPDRSVAQRRPLSRGSSPSGYPAEPLVSYRINRQLSGWNLPPLVIRAFGAHCHQRT